MPEKESKGRTEERGAEETMQLFAGMTESVATKLGFIAERAAREKELVFNQVMHHINEESLKASYQELKKDTATGVDGVSWKEYGEKLEENIKRLMERIKKMSYRPQAVRRVNIPKENGKLRPIGIPTIEDKMVQKAMSWVMEAIYEANFHESSYGFRRGKGCHQALKRINGLMREQPINHVIEVDIKGYFDNVSHGKLKEVIERRINDKRFVRYIVRFLKSGYMEKEAFVETEKGTPQGGNLSPMLANVFMHYVVDEWIEKEVKPRMKGKVHMVRYCDDFVILVQYQEEAQKIREELGDRLKTYELEINDEKSQVMSFGRYERENAKRAGRKANTFDFLGITHYCAASRWGRFKVGRQTSQKRFRRSIKEMEAWLKAVRNTEKLRGLWAKLITKMKGHYAYYGVSDNIYSLGKYYQRVMKMIFKWLNRRSQRQSFNWSQFNLHLEKYPLPEPKIMHRFYAPLKIGEA